MQDNNDLNKLHESRNEKDGTTQQPINPLQVNIPEGLDISYTDSAFVHTNDYGVVIDFAQRVGTTNRQNIVSRVGMSYEHAKALLDVLKKNLKDQKK